jgi:hypothetical protein
MYSQNGGLYYQGYSQDQQISNEELKFVIDTCIDRTFKKVPSLVGNKVGDKFEKNFFNQNDQIMEVKALVKRLKNNFGKNYGKYEKNIVKIGYICAGIIKKLECYIEYYENVESALSNPISLDQYDVERFNLISNALGNNIMLKSDQLVNIHNQKIYLNDLKNALFEKVTKLENEVKSIIKENGVDENINNPKFSKAIDNLKTIESNIENIENYNLLQITNTNIRISQNSNCFRPKKSNFAFYN